MPVLVRARIGGFPVYLDQHHLSREVGTASYKSLHTEGPASKS